MKDFRQFIKSLSEDESGFTLPEMITVLVVTAVFSGLLIFFGFSYWRYGALMEADMDSFVTRLNAGDVLREHISSSSGMIMQNSIPDPNRHVPDPDDVTNSFWLPIHAVPGNRPMGSPGTFTSLSYYKRLSFDTNNNIIMNGAHPYEDEYIIYMDGSTRELRIRALANPAAPGNRLLTSCPKTLATSTCPADRVIASDIESVDLRFFSRTGNLIDYTSVFDPNINDYIGPDYTAVEVMEFKLNLTKKPFLQKDADASRTSTIIRIALRNT